MNEKKNLPKLGENKNDVVYFHINMTEILFEDLSTKNTLPKIWREI